MIRHVFEGKKVFILASAPDPKIDYEKVKDHVWVCMKGSGWGIRNHWDIDRVPDITFFCAHLNYRLENMYQHLDTKMLIHLQAHSALVDPYKLARNEYVMEESREEIEAYYKEHGMTYDELVISDINSTAYSFRRLCEFNYFVHAGMFYNENVSFGLGVLSLILDCGAEEVVLSGFSLIKGKHSYSGRNLTKFQVLGLHCAEDMASLKILMEAGHNVKTFEPELHRVASVPMK